MKAQLFQIHKVLGRSLGALLVVILITGSFLSVSNELDWLTTSALRVDPGEEYAPLDTWVEAVQAHSPHAYIDRITMPFGDNSAADVTVRRFDGTRFRAFIDPYTGELTGTGHWVNIHRFLRDFHRMLFFPETIGLFLVTPFAFLMLIQLISALSFQKNLGKAFTSLPTGTSAIRKLATWHRFTGFWAILFAAIVGLTGSWYFIEHSLEEAGNPVARVEPVDPPAPQEFVNPAWSLDELEQRVGEVWPAFRTEVILFPRKAGNGLVFYGQGDAAGVRYQANFVAIDPFTGDIIDQSDARDLGPIARWVETVDDIHFGNFLGTGSKIIWLFLGLALTGTAGAGLLLGLKRAQQQGHPARSWLVVLGGTAVLSTVMAVDLIDGYNTSFDKDYASLGVQSAGPVEFELAHTPDGTFAIMPQCSGCLVNAKSMDLATSGPEADKVSPVSMGNIYAWRAKLPAALDALAVTLIVESFDGRQFTATWPMNAAVQTGEAE